MKLKTYNLLILILISSCTSQSITISSSIPSPLVDKNQNISVVTVYEDEIKNYLFESTPLETTDFTWEIDFKEAQKKIFNPVFDSKFSNIKTGVEIFISLLPIYSNEAVKDPIVILPEFFINISKIKSLPGDPSPDIKTISSKVNHGA